MDNEVEHKHQHHTEHKAEENKLEDELEEEEEEVSCSSDSEIGDALDWLDSRDEGDALDGSFSSSLSCWRPNAHGGHHSHSSALQPHSNGNQKFSYHIRASPLEIPSPYFSEGNQFRNASLMADLAGVTVITEDELDSSTLAIAIEEILRDKKKMKDMSERF